MEQQQQQSSPHSDIILDCNDDSLPSEESLSYFRTYGHYIPEFYFLNEICFNSNEFEPYMNCGCNTHHLDLNSGTERSFNNNLTIE